MQVNKNEVVELVSKARANSKDRNFLESFEVIFNIRDVDVKQTSNNFSLYLSLPNLNKKRSLCALVDKNTKKEIKGQVDKVILDSDFEEYSDARKAKKLANSYDYFISQTNLMPNVARYFGRYLGPRKKMPSPSAGSVITPGEGLDSEKKFRNMVTVTFRDQPVIQCLVGDEKLKDEEVAENFMLIYRRVIENLPSRDLNIDSITIKTTMGKPAKLS
ncbi:MAG: 50S ribosomal protein L1 [Candidatus Woesearchaeota archaeon]